MQVPVKLLVGKKIIEGKALIDSGAGGIFINKAFADKHGLETRDLAKPLLAYNVDGTPNKQGTIKKAVKGKIQIGKRQMETGLLVTGLGDQDIILGFNWLHKEDPEIDWNKGTIQWPSKVTMEEEKEVDHTMNPIPEWFPTTSTLITEETFQGLQNSV